MNIKNLIIGGGAINKELEQELRAFPNAVWSTYGMTETLSHIALRRLSGPEASEWYTPFDNVEVTLNKDGCLIINAPLVHEGLLMTNDIAELCPAKDDCKQSFRIIGRKDNVICSGGLKLHIEKLEAMLAYLIDEAQMSWAITKRPDPKFGEVAILITTDKHYNIFYNFLNGHKSGNNGKSPTIPTELNYIKDIILVPDIPMTATGKVDRKAAMDLARHH